MVFKEVQWGFYLFSICALFIIFASTGNISERFDKGKIIRSDILKRLLWINKNQDYISYPSLVFVILGYIYVIAGITCYIVCLFVSDLAGIWIAGIYNGVLLLTGIIEIPFLPPYGTRGS